MGSQTFNAIYIGTIGQPNIYDIDFNRGGSQTNRPNDPDWLRNGGLDTDETTAEGAGLFVNRTYSNLEVREITLTVSAANDF